MKKICTALAAVLITCTAWSQTLTGLTLQPVGSGFAFPVDLQNAGDERMFVVEKAGLIIAWNMTTGTKDTFLNITDRVLSAGFEQGLLGLAFHPDYANNGYFYVNYTTLDSTGDSSGTTRISRFVVSASDSNKADANDETILLTQDQPYENHNGGWLAFGPDGYLYIALGDGGSAGDPLENAMNLSTLLGKVLRIDVNATTGYDIPAGNPFVGVAGALPEIYYLGLRNHFRNSFDAFTGDLWIADVGQDMWEEINHIPAGTGGGLNFGWDCYEAFVPFESGDCPADDSLTFPIYAYDHDSITGDCSVLGGYVYRGSSIASLYGHYLFSDFCSGLVRMLSDESSGWTSTEVVNGEDFQHTSWGMDVNGELYITQINGDILMLVDTTCSPVAVILGSDTISSCGTALLQALESPDLTYQWYSDSGIIVGETNSAITVANLGSYYLVVTDTTCGESDTSDPVMVIEGILTVDLNVTNNECGDTASGSIEATVSGGAVPYTFIWSTGDSTSLVTGLADGFYSVTVVDSLGCTGLAEAEVITSGGGLTVTATATPAACGEENGMVTATVDGGNAPYSFAWSNGSTDEMIDSLTAGDYSVTVTDVNGCTGTATANVETSGAPDVTISIDSVNCDLSTVILTANASGDNGPFTFIWNDGNTNQTITVSGGGPFIVTVTDTTGCSAVDSTFVLPTPPLLVNILGDTTVCPGETTTLTTDADNMTYLWSTGDTTSSITVGEGTYGVTVYTSDGCVAGTAEETVTTNPLPTLSFTITNATSGQSNGSADLTVTGGDAPFTFNWSDGSTDEDLMSVSSGTYTVTVITAEGCSVMDSVAIGEDSVVVDCAAPTNLTVDNITSTSADINWDAVDGATQYTVQYRPVGDTTWLTVGVDTNNLFLFTLDPTTTYELQVQTVCGDSSSGMTMTTFTTLGTGGCTMTVNVGHTDVTCFGLQTGSATAVPVGGTGPYTYLWSNGRTQSSLPKLKAGSYSVTVTDANGCTAVGTVNISQPANILAYHVSTQTCPGQCTGTSTINLFSGGIAPFTYLWSNGETTTTITNLCAGVYWVTITDASGCKKIVGANISANPNVCGPGGPGPLRINGEADQTLSLYPNPADAVINVSLPTYDGNAYINVYNAIGQLVMTTHVESVSNAALNVSEFAAGIYHLQFVYNDLVETAKFVKH